VVGLAWQTAISTVANEGRGGTAVEEGGAAGTAADGAAGVVCGTIWGRDTRRVRGIGGIIRGIGGGGEVCRGAANDKH
jgi:hypothetical protein